MSEISFKRLIPYLILAMILGFSFLTAAIINARQYGSIYRIDSNKIENIWLSQSLNLTFINKSYELEVIDGLYYTALLNPINGSTNLTLIDTLFSFDYQTFLDVKLYSCPLPASGIYYGLSKAGGLFWTLEGHGEKALNEEGIHISQNLVGFLPNGPILFNYTLVNPDFSSYSQLFFPRTWFSIRSEEFWVIEAPYHAVDTATYQPAYRNLSIYSLGTFQLIDSYKVPYDPIQFNIDDHDQLWIRYLGNPKGRPILASIYGYNPTQSHLNSIEKTIQILTPIPSGDLTKLDPFFIEASENINIHRIFASSDRLICSLKYQDESSPFERLLGFRVISLKSAALIPLGYGLGGISITSMVIVFVVYQIRQKKLHQSTF